MHDKSIQVISDPEEDWSDLHAQTKDQLIREHIEMIEESRISTTTMIRARDKIEELRGEAERLRSVAEQLLEVVMLDPAGLTYGMKRRRAIEAAGDAGVTIP